MRFFVGDDNGQLKSVRCSKSSEDKWSIEASILDDGGMQGKSRGIQRLVVKKEKIALARSDGSCTLFCAQEGTDSVEIAQQWQDTRFKPEHQYIGLGITESGGVISCTSAGHLRLQHTKSDLQNIPSDTTFLPNRLCDLIVDDDATHFAYGGDEVEVSVWDTAKAFDPSRRLLSASTGTKRKKHHSDLIDGEIWRAKNVSNDFLNLRHPVHNTTLTFLSPISNKNGPSCHILAGTRIGSVRRYDTRAARKPVADWKNIGRVGGVKKVQKGISEYDAFIADYGGNLFALDLRNGRVLYGYSGISGAISSLAPISSSSSLSPSLLASTSLDRFFHLHSAYKPAKTSEAIDKKGDTLKKHWLNSVAGCVAWDGFMSKQYSRSQENDEGEDDVWAGMQHTGEEQASSGSASESEYRRPKSKARKQETG